MLLYAIAIIVSGIALAQYPPPIAYSTVLKSPVNPNITISYKQPEPGTCTTVFTTQKQYSGYINLPPYTLAAIQQNYSINTFFWFVEARQQPEVAPLTIWLNGGPGSSSLVGLFQENGPCEVIQVADGSYGTQSRMWGWDRSSNILYIDQPSLVGFSYDILANASLQLVNNTFNPPGPAPSGIPSSAWLNGTFGSQMAAATANTTEIAAYAVWHFLQGWLSAFPQYNPGIYPNSTSNGTAGVNLFTESYGGLYGPAFAELWEEMNDKRRNGSLSRNKTLEISLTSLGIINGLVDPQIQYPSLIRFASNNSYGIKAIDSVSMYNGMASFRGVGGCNDTITQCQRAVSLQDPEGEGDVAEVNRLCSNAVAACGRIENIYAPSGRSFYDIRQQSPSPFPSEAYLEYLNTDTVLRSIGSPVNFTETSDAVFSAFQSTGDPFRGGQLAALARLLKRNVRIALIYGDADYICNWLGGEAVSLALAALLPGYAASLPQAGYADIVVNASYIGGAVRQFGNLSFARVYDAGHQVPAYQPETAFTLFTRVIRGTALSTGEKVNLATYRTSGPNNSSHVNKPPPGSAAWSPASQKCYLRALQQTCPPDSIAKLLAGKGAVIGGVWYETPSDYSPPASSVVAGKPGQPIAYNGFNVAMGNGVSSTVVVTGVYTATGTPKVSGAIGMGKMKGETWRVFGLGLVVVVVLWGG